MAVYSLFQSENNTECGLVLSLSSNLSFTERYPVAAYVPFLVFLPLLYFL
jgi:hypothetical protein